MMRNVTMALLAAAMLPVSAQAQMPPAGYTDKDVQDLNGLFDQIDRNKDGKVTKLEMSSYGATRRLGVLKGKGWKQLDSDGNGTVSRDEFVKEMFRHDAMRRRARR